MTQEIRMWEVTPDGATIKEVEGSGISREEHLEDWLESDVSLADSDLLVIGRQVKTDFGRIDLLCIDSSGDLVVVEIKRGRMRRKAVAQALDYASWVKDLSREDVCGIAQDYYGDRTLDTAFQERFDAPLPDVVNGVHRSLVVGQSTDADAERLVRYLSASNVPINMATVHHFTDQAGRELLVGVHLVDQDEARKRQAAHARGRKPPLLSELEGRATKSDTGDQYSALRDGLHGVFRRPSAISNDIGFQWRIKGESKKDVRTTLIKVTPESADRRLRFEVHVKRCEDHLGLSLEQLKAVLPENTRQEDLAWRRLVEGEVGGLKGSFGTVEEVEAFTKALNEAVQRLG